MAECETALNRSLMDPQDERPATQHRRGGGGVGRRGVGGSQVRGQPIITPPKSSLPPSLHHHHNHPFLSHLTAQCLMIINTLKHLRSAGSERTPERETEMRGEEGDKGGEGGMVMMCLHMICWIDITNHLVPTVTPLGHAHTLVPTLWLIQAIYFQTEAAIST